MNNITIGQYVKGNSWIYKVDPRMKIILTILLVVLIFLIPNITGMLIALGVFVVIFLTTRIPFLKMIKGLKPVLFLLIFTFVLQLIFTTSEEAPLIIFDFQFGLYQMLICIGIIVFYYITKKLIPFKLLYMILMLLSLFLVQYLCHFNTLTFIDYSLNVYEVGLIKGVFIFVRIILMIGITSLLTFTTMSTEINNGLSAVLSPLKVIKVPVGVISMTLSLTLRFIPTLLEETNKIMKAQASRGVDFSEGSLKDKVKQIISLLVPMFVVSFKRAEDLAYAMEARGYIIDAPRTRIDLLKLKSIDFICLISVIILFAIIIWSNFGFVGLL